MNLTYLFISHDLSVVKFISDKIGVMYLGQMVEFGKKDDIFANPLHPYTRALFSAIPSPNPDVKMKRISNLVKKKIKVRWVKADSYLAYAIALNFLVKSDFL